MVLVTKLPQKLSGSQVANCVFGCCSKKIMGKRVLCNGVLLPRAMASLFSLTLIRNVSAIRFHVCSSHLLMHGSAQYQATQRSEICGHSSLVARHWNTRAVLTSIGALTIAGTASPWCQARSAPFAKTRSMKQAG